MAEISFTLANDMSHYSNTCLANQFQQQYEDHCSSLANWFGHAGHQCSGASIHSWSCSVL